MLAYVFWHAPAPGTAVADYERALAAFHGVLAGAPPAGFHGSAAARLDGPPWPGGAAAYEDWYLVEDWAALGTLNEAAVAGARRAPHDAAAAMARDGVAGVYAPVRGAVAPPREAHAAWLAKLAGDGLRRVPRGARRRARRGVAAPDDARAGAGVLRARRRATGAAVAGGGAGAARGRVRGPRSPRLLAR